MAWTSLPTPTGHRWCQACNRVCPARSNDELRGVASEGEGACSPLFKIRSHLPLRGKLGWMTPRVGVKTTLTMERATGALVPKQGPHFFARGTATSAPSHAFSACDEFWLSSSTTCLEICSR